MCPDAAVLLALSAGYPRNLPRSITGITRNPWTLAMKVEMFAVIKTGGKQYRVAKDDVVVVEKLDGKAGAAITFKDVLMTGDGKTLKLGKDLAGVTVTGKLVEIQKGGRSRCSRSAAAAPAAARSVPRQAESHIQIHLPSAARATRNRGRHGSQESRRLLRWS